MASLAGQTIGAYQIRSRLGAGGMGEVYQARDTKLARDVAVKVLAPDVLHDPARLARFRREAQVLAAINHPGIATVYSFEESAGQPCIVMELVPGSTLAEQLKSGPLPLDDALRISTDVAKALQAAHKLGITHRDIKPPNIKVTPDGRVKVLDFGLAKLREQPDSPEVDSETATHVQTTVLGEVAGTPAYMSPEQLRGATVDHRTDIWAFGCLLYELLTARRTFAGAGLADIVAAVMAGEPAWEALPPATPQAIRHLLRCCLEKDCGQRPPDMAEVLAVLEGAPLPRAELRKVAGTGIRSLAVLPFANAADDPQIDYLCDGLTESIIFSLSHLPTLHVMARSGVFRHKGSDADARDIGRELGVSAVATGRVRQRGETLLITAELVEVGSGWQLWGAQYRRQAGDIFAIEEDIAREISATLRLKLTPEKQDLLARRRAESAEAYHLYLKGRYHWGKRTEEGLLKALQYFREAIDTEPTYALAHAGLAEGYVPLAVYGYLDPREAMPKARAAARRALEIEPELSEALTVLASTKIWYDRDLAGAEDILQKSLALDAAYPRGHQTLAESLTLSGRFDEAQLEMERALELDPLSLHTNAAAVMHAYFARRAETAIAYGRRAVDLDEHFFPSRLFLGLAWQQSGDLQNAVAELERARALARDVPMVSAALAGANALSGNTIAARGVLGELRGHAATRYVSPTALAVIHTALNETPSALDCLDRACEEHCVWVQFAVVADPRFDALRNEPRFHDIARRAVARA